MITPVMKKGQEKGAAIVRCDGCADEMTLVRPVMGGFVDGRQISTKEERIIVRHAVRDHSWTKTHRKLLCPKCAEPVRKPKPQELTLVPVPKTPAAPVYETIKLNPPEETSVFTDGGNGPTREQRRQITDALDEAYDTGRQRYQKDRSDRALAEVLHLPKQWIRDLRMLLYGDHDRNEAEDQTKTFIAVMEKRIAAAEDTMLKLLTGRDTLEKAINNQAQILDVMRADFDKFVKAQ